MSEIYPSVKRLRAACTWCALVFFSFYLLKNTAEAAGAVSAALELCVKNVIPSLFPYMVLSSLILSSGMAEYLGRLLARPFGRLFALSGNCAAAVIIGLAAGFPVGAKTAAETLEKGLCKQEEAQRLCAFCNNTGPAFVIGGIGAGFFGDPMIGVLLYAIEVASVLILGLLLSIGHPRRRADTRTVVRFRPDLGGAVRGAVTSTLTVCGFVVFFSVLTDAVGLVFAHGALAPALPLAAVLLEVTNGAHLSAGISGPLSLILAAFAIGWSGLCVHAQSASYLLGQRLNMRKYLTGKAVQGLICAGLAALVCLFLQNI